MRASPIGYLIGVLLIRTSPIDHCLIGMFLIGMSPIDVLLTGPSHRRVSHRRLSHRRPSHRRVSHRRASHIGNLIDVPLIGAIS
jgi:hypothetical protein